MLAKRFRLGVLSAVALCTFSLALSYLHLREQRVLSQHQFSIFLLAQITPILNQTSWPLQSQQLSATVTALQHLQPALQQLRLVNKQGEDIYLWSLPQVQLSNTSLQFNLAEKISFSGIDRIHLKFWQPISVSTLMLMAGQIIAVVGFCLLPFTALYFYGRRKTKQQVLVQTLNPSQVDLRAELANVSAYIVTQLDSRYCQFVFHCAPALPKYLYFDSELFSRILITLLRQAQKISTDDVVVLKLDWQLQGDKVTLLASICTGCEINDTSLVLAPDRQAQRLMQRLQGELNYTASAKQTLQYKITLPTKLGRRDPLMDADQRALRRLMMGKQILLVDCCRPLQFHLQELLGFYGAIVHCVETLDQAEVWLRRRSAQTDLALISCPQQRQGFDGQLISFKEQLQIIQCPLIVLGQVKDEALFLHSPRLNKQFFLYKPIVEPAILASLRTVFQECEDPPPELNDQVFDQVQELPDFFQGIQVQLALQRLGRSRPMSNRVAMYRGLLNAFCLRHSEGVKSIVQFIQDGDDVEACRCAHNLKGIAATIGAVELQKSAADFETAVRQGHHQELSLSILQRSLAQTQNAIEALSVLLDPPL